MSLFPQSLTRYGFTYDNIGTNPSATPGTSVTPGASGVEGSWTQIASSANIAQDCYWVFLRFSNAAEVGIGTAQHWDFGIDPAGGTSYTAAWSNMLCGAGGTITQGGYGHVFLIPWYIKAGSSVAVRISSGDGSPLANRVCAKFWGQPDRPECVPVGQFAELQGVPGGSLDGEYFTPGNAADGSWVAFTTTTSRPLWWWQLGIQINDTAMTNEGTYIDVAYGDGTNKHVFMRHMIIGGTSEQISMLVPANLWFPDAYRPVPTGSQLYIRGRCDSAPESNYNALLLGIGG